MLLYGFMTLMALGSVLFIWGLVRLRKGNAQAYDAIRKVRLEDLPELLAEGKEVLKQEYGLTIDFADREATSKILDDLFADHFKLKNAFARNGFYWRFVLPVGVLVGEFIRIHGNGVWKKDSDGLLMEFPIQDGVATCYPFDKILKQVNQGAKGDMYAFLQLGSSQLEA